jgi:hypothetical protein
MCTDQRNQQPFAKLSQLTLRRTEFFRALMLRGRPPFAPFARAAAAFTFVRRLPPRRPISAIHRRVPKIPAAKPGM